MQAALPPARAWRYGVTALALVACFFPLTEDIRNHLHPRLRVKHDEYPRYQELETIIAEMNRIAQPGGRIAGCSELRQLHFAFRNPLVGLPAAAEDFTSPFFTAHNVSRVIIGIRNLGPAEQATERLYLRQYWRADGDSLIEMNRPGFLQPCFSTRTHIVYNIVQ
jgi:hypothetical protein